MSIIMNESDYAVVRMALNTTIDAYRADINNVYMEGEDLHNAIHTLYKLSETMHNLDTAYIASETAYNAWLVDSDNTPF